MVILQNIKWRIRQRGLNVKFTCLQPGIKRVTEGFLFRITAIENKVIIFSIFLLLVLLQRALELLFAKRHERKLKNLGAKEIDKSGYSFIVAMHAAFFASLILEKIFLNTQISRWWMFLGLLFCLAQILRYWAIASLGVYWNTKVLVVPHHPILKGGPYGILRHPNYIAVITELAVIPLIFSCYITSIVFTIVNALVILRRIRIEMRALKEAIQ